jgi:hypothetical protein
MRIHLAHPAPARLPACLSIRPSVHPFIRGPSPPTRVFIYLSVYPSVCLPSCPSIHVSVWPSVYDGGVVGRCPYYRMAESGLYMTLNYTHTGRRHSRHTNWWGSAYWGALRNMTASNCTAVMQVRSPVWGDWASGEGVCRI